MKINLKTKFLSLPWRGWQAINGKYWYLKGKGKIENVYKLSTDVFTLLDWAWFLEFLDLDGLISVVAKSVLFSGRFSERKKENRK